MPILQTVRGQIVDLRRHTNVHLYWRGHYGPTERYEVWLRDTDACEHQFTIHSRTMPARRGHDISLLIDADAVRGIVNWSTGKCVNYLRTDPPPLLKLRDLWALPILFAALVTKLGVIGLLLVLPALLLYILGAVAFRYIDRRRRKATIERALREVQRQHNDNRPTHRRNKSN
ncbi:MAG TPA: hypothetical protein VIF82_18300 [Burkholderiaceae bacterium]|jgi:hypothetical protein